MKKFKKIIWITINIIVLLIVLYYTSIMIIQTINGINIDFGDNAAVGFWKVDPGIPAIKEYFTTLGEITYPIYITFLILIILDIYFIRKNKCIKDK